MSDRSIEHVNLVASFVAHRSMFYVLKDEQNELEDGSVGGAVAKFTGSEWGEISLPFQAPTCVDVVAQHPNERAVDVTIVSVEGDYFQAGSIRARQVGEIDSTEKGPRGKGWIRGLKRIGESIFAVGMCRQAYVREGDAWRRIDAGILAAASAVVGLNDVDGFSPNEVYAAGLKGELWRYDGQTWHSVPSPTNVQLNAVRRIGDHIYVAGSSGVVLRGRHDQFKVVATEDDLENLYGIEGFQGSVFVASSTAVYRLDDDTLTRLDLLDGELTSGHLHANDGVLLSTGSGHLLRTDDGQTWTQIYID